MCDAFIAKLRAGARELSFGACAANLGKAGMRWLVLTRISRVSRSRAALGFAVLAAFDAVSSATRGCISRWCARITSTTEWPTFSRVLTLQDDRSTRGWPRSAAPGCSRAALRSRRCSGAARAKSAVSGRAGAARHGCAGALAAPLGVVHYFHMTVTLSARTTTCTWRSRTRSSSACRR